MDNMLVPLSKNKAITIEVAGDVTSLIDQNRLALGILAVAKVVADMGADFVGGVARTAARTEVELDIYIQYRDHMHKRIVPILAVMRAAAEGFRHIEHENLPPELLDMGRTAVINIATEMLRAHINLPKK